nr:hypothetical protein [Tanacetum cinerariifolium]
MIFNGMLRNLDNVSGKILMYPRFIQKFLDKQLDGLQTHKEKHDVSFHTKKVFANMKRISKGYSAEQDSGNTDKTQTKATSNEPSSQGTSSGDGLRFQDTMRDTSADTSSSDDEALDKEDTSEHGRIDEIDADEDVALVSTHDDVSTQDNIDQDEGIEDISEEEVVEVVTTAKMIIDTVVDASQVTTAIVDIPVSAAETIVTTALTITAESTKTNVEVQDKGKRKAKLLEELEMPKKRKHQIRAEKELAEKQAKIDAEDRLARERESLKGTRSKRCINQHMG